jgi:hypothetical protein
MMRLFAKSKSHTLVNDLLHYCLGSDYAILELF